MTFPVYIPSRGRASSIMDKDRTLWWLQGVPNVFVVIRPDDEKKYRFHCPEGTQFLVVDAPHLSTKRKMICEHAASLPGSWSHVQLDDDLRWFRRVAPDDWHLRQMERSEMPEVLTYLRNSIEVGGHAASSISSREGNNRQPYPEILNSRIMRVLAFNTKALAACDIDRLQVRADLDIALQLLRMGLSNSQSTEFAQDHRSTQEKGGCSIYRTHEMQDATARALAELHPGFVSLRQKKNKTGGDFGERTEVTIQWKKAYQAGCDAVDNQKAARA